MMIHSIDGLARTVLLRNEMVGADLAWLSACQVKIRRRNIIHGMECSGTPFRSVRVPEACKLLYMHVLSTGRTVKLLARSRTRDKDVLAVRAAPPS